MNIVLASDHGGFALKQRVLEHLTARGLAFEDLGSFTGEPVDYPEFAAEVAGRIADGRAERGVVICTSGNGVAMTANKFPGVRAALCLRPEMAEYARRHNDANVLALSGKFMTPDEATAVLDVWLDTGFDGGRHARRLRRMNDFERAAAAAALLRETDPELAATLGAEDARQRMNLELIASENYTSAAVRAAAGSRMTNKYAEGYPGKRWYNGCEHVDAAERLALERACKLFGADHANVQPHCGSAANMAVYFAMLQPGDTLMAMSLADGGHLTHGHKMNFSGRFFNIVPYGVRKDTEQIDYDALEALALQHRPRMITAGASAYARVLDFPRLRAIADAVGAWLMVDMAHIAGLVAGQQHPNPVPYADFVTSTTHKTLRGPRGGLILCREKYAADIDKQVFPGIQGGPLMHVIAAKAVCFHEALQPAFREYATQIVANARALAAGLAAQDFRLVSGGTENHLMLVDLSALNLSGKDAATALDRASITVNKNAIPFDTRSPFQTSGIRIGTAAVTTRGMKEHDMVRIGEWIGRVLRAPADEAVLSAVRAEVAAFTAKFPIP
jgi:glycine hydroxymethyltransferase